MAFLTQSGSPERRERRPKLTRNRRSGFTMVELMIVMAIITILISIAVPYYQKTLIRSKETLMPSGKEASSIESGVRRVTGTKPEAPFEDRI